METNKTNDLSNMGVYGQNQQALDKLKEAIERLEAFAALHNIKKVS